MAFKPNILRTARSVLLEGLRTLILDQSTRLSEETDVLMEHGYSADDISFHLEAGSFEITVHACPPDYDEQVSLRVHT